MDYSNDYPKWDYKEEDIARKFTFFNVLKDGRVHVLEPHTSETMKIPPSQHPMIPITGVQIKDVKLSEEVQVRMFLPPSPKGKLPVLVYIHGGAFCMGSAFSVEYTRFLTNLVSHSNILAVSVEYGLYPTRPIPACYDDSWFALQWVASHVEEGSTIGPVEPWINDHADLKRIFVGGDSAGGTISHNIVARVGNTGLPGEAKVKGMILIHPYFGEGEEMWMYICTTNEGPHDRRMKPAPEDLAILGCERVLVEVAEKDEFELRDKGTSYGEELKKSGWKGKVELVENVDKKHCFHLGDYLDPEAIAMIQRIIAFILK